VEFENALRPDAADWLASALHTGGTWGIPGGADFYYALFLGDFGTLSSDLPPVPVPGTSPCTAPRVLPIIEGELEPFGLFPEGCYIIETAAWERTGLETPATGIGTDLIRGDPNDENGSRLFRAGGSVVADQDGLVDYVESFVWKFIPGTEISGPFQVIGFTARTLEAVEVAAGQEIQVIFEVTFH
jgi:hypothetical protein